MDYAFGMAEFEGGWAWVAIPAVVIWASMAWEKFRAWRAERRKRSA